MQQEDILIQVPAMMPMIMLVTWQTWFPVIPRTPKAACSRSGQGAVMFAIGLGPTVVTSPVDGSGVAYGDTLLRYVGAVGDDGDPGTDPCSTVTYPGTDYNCGNYYFSSTGSGLNAVFQQIASRVFTRLAK